MDDYCDYWAKFIHNADKNKQHKEAYRWDSPVIGLLPVRSVDRKVEVEGVR